MIDKKTVDFIMNEGNKLLTAADCSRSIEHFDRIINECVSSGIYLAYYNKGVALASLGRNAEATKCFLQYIELTSHENAEDCMEKGKYLFKHNIPEAAIIFYEEAIHRNSALAEAHCCKGITLSSMRKYQEAIFCFENAILHDPKYVEAYYEKFMAIYNITASNFSIPSAKKMLACLDIAIRLDPAFTKAYIAKGKVFHDMGGYSEALAIYEEAIKIEPNDIVYHNKALTLETTGEDEKALECYNKAINLNPNNYYVYYDRGIFFKKRGLYDQAINDFNAVLKLPSDDFIREKARIEIAKITHQDLEVTSYEKESVDQPIRFNEKKVDEPKTLSIKRAFELSLKLLETAKNSLAPPAKNRIFIDGMGGACYLLAVSMELFLKGCILYYKDVWINGHSLEYLKSELLKASERTNYKLNLTPDTLKKIEELKNLTLRYDTGEAGTHYVSVWFQIVLEILLQAPDYLYTVFRNECSMLYYQKDFYHGKEFQLVKSGLRDLLHDIKATYDKLCSEEGCRFFVSQIITDKINEVVILDLINYLVRTQKLVKVKHIKAINNIIELCCLDSEGVEYCIEVQTFKKSKDYEDAYKRKVRANHNKAVVFLDIADCILFPDKDEYLTTEPKLNSHFISLALRKFTRDTEIAGIICKDSKKFLGYMVQEFDVEKLNLLEIFIKIYQIMNPHIHEFRVTKTESTIYCEYSYGIYTNTVKANV